MSIGLNFGEEYLKMTELKKIEIRIEKEQRRNDSMKAKGRSPPTFVQNEQKLLMNKR